MDNQQAFPLGANEYGGHGSEAGMTLRDYFAAKAVAGLMSSNKNGTFDDYAESAYLMADEMLKARAKPCS